MKDQNYEKSVNSQINKAVSYADKATEKNSDIKIYNHYWNRNYVEKMNILCIKFGRVNLCWT